VSECTIRNMCLAFSTVQKPQDVGVHGTSGHGSMIVHSSIQQDVKQRQDISEDAVLYMACSRVKVGWHPEKTRNRLTSNQIDDPPVIVN